MPYTINPLFGKVRNYEKKPLPTNKYIDTDDNDDQCNWS